MKIIIASLILVASSLAMADNYTQGYVRKDGTYVEGHYKTAPDRNPYNNYSTQGNSNPYTGREGTRDPYQAQQQYGGQRAPDFYGQQRRQHNNGW